jgi:hypothetical protein
MWVPRQPTSLENIEQHLQDPDPKLTFLVTKQPRLLQWPVLVGEMTTTMPHPTTITMAKMKYILHPSRNSMESCNPLETPILCDASPNAMSS